MKGDIILTSNEGTCLHASYPYHIINVVVQSAEIKVELANSPFISNSLIMSTDRTVEEDFAVLVILELIYLDVVFTAYNLFMFETLQC